MKKFLIIALLFMAPFWWFHLHRQPKTDPQALATTIKPEPPPVELTLLDKTVNDIIAANQDMAISVSIADVDRNKFYQYGDSSAYEAASATKLITAIYLLHQVELGQLSLSDDINGKSAGEQLKQMIEVSDNDGWHNLNNALTHQKLVEYASSIGLTSYDPITNTVSSNDIAMLLAQFYQDKLLDKEHTELLLSYMQRADSADYIPAAVRTGLTTYHKAGYLEDRILDTAIITDGMRSFVLVIFTKSSGPYDSVRGINIIHEITKSSVATYLP